MSYPDNKFSKIIAVNSIEHIFVQEKIDDVGDVAACRQIARVLKPGGYAVVTVPMSGGGGFHAAPKGDATYSLPYRLYTIDDINSRFGKVERLCIRKMGFLAHTTPLLPGDNRQFHRFWLGELKEEDRGKWMNFFPVLSAVFNPIIEVQEAARRREDLNTAAILFQKE